VVQADRMTRTVINVVSSLRFTPAVQM